MNEALISRLNASHYGSIKLCKSFLSLLNFRLGLNSEHLVIIEIPDCFATDMCCSSDHISAGNHSSM